MDTRDKVLKLVEIKEQIRNLEEMYNKLKTELIDEIPDENEFIITDNMGRIITAKKRIRYSKKFNKKELADTIKVDKSLLDYYGISKLTYDGEITPELLLDYKEENFSKFLYIKVE